MSGPLFLICGKRRKEKDEDEATDKMDELEIKGDEEEEGGEKEKVKEKKILPGNLCKRRGGMRH